MCRQNAYKNAIFWRKKVSSLELLLYVSDYEVELYIRKIRNTSSGYNDLL